MRRASIYFLFLPYRTYSYMLCPSFIIAYRSIISFNFLNLYILEKIEHLFRHYSTSLTLNQGNLFTNILWFLINNSIYSKCQRAAAAHGGLTLLSSTLPSIGNRAILNNCCIPSTSILAIKTIRQVLPSIM